MYNAGRRVKRKGLKAFESGSSEPFHAFVVDFFVRMYGGYVFLNACTA